MILYPDKNVKNVREVTLQMLEENGIKGILLDVDNTLINYKEEMEEETITWCDNLKKQGIKFCILSNSNKREKIKRTAQKLQIPYVSFAKKPLKLGFRKAKEMLQLSEEEIAVIGDQIFTDILGANRIHMYSILVEPIEEKDIWITVLKRPIENWIKKCYQKQKNKRG